MGLYERIRRDNRLEGLSVRALAARHRVHRRTVREALSCAVPLERKTPERTATALSAAHRATVRGWLVEDRGAPRKQRHTARRVWQRLVAEEGAAVAESTVRAFVAEVRRELGSGTALVAVPQTHPPAEEAEVDFGEFKAWIRGDAGAAVDVRAAAIPQLSWNANTWKASYGIADVAVECRMQENRRMGCRKDFP